MQTLCQLFRGLIQGFEGPVLSYAKLGVEISAAGVLKIQLFADWPRLRVEMRNPHVLMMWVNLLVNQ